MKKLLALPVLLLLSFLLLSGCQSSVAPVSSTLENPVTLTLAGMWEEFRAMEEIGTLFRQKYPNCQLNYEYLQNYSELLPKRLEKGADAVDLFITPNIQSGSPYLPYALELFSHSDQLDLSDTFDGLVENFVYKNPDSNAARALYAIPIGAELRGMYVNKTLLNTLGLSVPTNWETFLSACQTLLDNGYIPLQCDPGRMGQTLFYPSVCNGIVNAERYDEMYARVNRCQEGVSELFRAQMEKMYTLVQKGYYNYKRMETTGYFLDASDEASVRYFLNIVDKNGQYEKKDDVGQVAFMPNVMSLGRTMEKGKADYHSKIDYAFILSPVGDEGGYAYMSPANGIAINQNANHVDWALKFLNFFFERENNLAFAKLHNVTPNTRDAFDQIKKTFDIPENRISHLGKATFDYAFYSVIANSLQEVAKGNNPKYMIDNGDGTYRMHPLEDYMQSMEARFAQYR